MYFPDVALDFLVIELCVVAAPIKTAELFGLKRDKNGK